MSSPRELLSDDYTYNSREEGYGGLSTGLMVLCIIIIYLSCIYFCKICRSCGSPPTAEAVAVPAVAVAVGLDEAILRSFPKVVYSKAKGSGKYSIASTGCSICLDDYKEKDVVSVLPHCGHFFHLKCINPWLRLHPSCPVCRTLPSSSPPSPPPPAV